MSEPFEIVDPVERFLEAKEEGVSAGIESAKWGRQNGSNQALWLTGAAVCLITCLMLVYALSPWVRGDFSSRLNEQSGSDTVSQPQASSRQSSGDVMALVPVAPPPTRGVHAINPETSAAQSSESQVTSQKPAPPSTAPNGQFSAASSKQPDQAISQDDDEDAHWVRTSLAAKVHSGPSVSTPIMTYHPVGTELRAIGYRNGWVQVVDPATSQRGWIYQVYLSPSNGPAPPQQSQAPDSGQQSTLAGLEMPGERGVSTPDPSTPAATSKKLRKYHGSNRHRARGGIVIGFGSRRLHLRF